MRSHNRNILLRSVAFAALYVSTTAYAQELTFKFDIPAEPLGQALVDFSQISSKPIFSSEDVVKGQATKGVHGQYTAQQALEVLLAGTNLKIAVNASGVLMVQSKNVEAASNEAASTTSHLETVTVTGTKIKGASPASPLLVLDRADIDRSGVATLGDLLKTVPEDFGGGQNPGVFGTSQTSAAYNYGDVSAANLRGLGSDSTLTLVNGRRLSYNGVQNGVDLSVIPLATISRVEIVTDGASALYGSDAVAGVVNVILKPDFDGFETSARWGTSTRGGAGQRQIDQIAGYSSSDAGFIAAYEHFDQLLLSARQRDFASQAAPNTTLVPDLFRDSGLVSAHWEPASNISLFVDGVFSHHGNTDFATQTTSRGTLTYNDNGRGDQYGLSGGIRLALFGDWTGAVTGTVSRDAEQYDSLLTSPLYGGTANYSSDTKYSFADSIYSFDGDAAGTVTELWAGPLAAAVSVGYRHESERNNFGPTSASREVIYGAVEASMPLVSDDPARLGLEKLTLSASVRVENYNDFGETANPKIGFVYAPFSDLTLKGTWSTSFHAPGLFQAYSPQLTYAEPASSCGSNLPGMVCLYGSGSNPNLQPEKANAWTMTQEYLPEWLPGAKLGLTEWEINYKSRIIAPFSTTAGTLGNPVYTPYIVTNPTAAQINAVTSLPYLYNNLSGLPVNTTTVYAYYEAYYQNAARQTATGWDLSASDALPTDVGTFEVSTSVSHITLDQYNTPASPAIKLSGTIFHVPSYRTRSGLTWTKDGISLSSFINFTDSVTDNSSTYVHASTASNVPVGSWTTVDFQGSYDFQAVAFLHDFRLSLAVQNLFDTNPPHVSSTSLVGQYAGMGYDATNASPVGRFVSLTLAAHL